MTYAVTLERGTDGTYLAWVDDLPGCAVRAPSRDEVLERLPHAIAEFVVWTGAEPPTEVAVTVSAEVESATDADEDTEVILAADRQPLTNDDWAQIERLLERSRAELLDTLDEHTPETVRHIAFVELMYAAWTFDVDSREGLREFLAWTRGITSDRLRELARRNAEDLTQAHWGGAPRPEAWTPRKAARRLLWHELLHLRKLKDNRSG